MFSWILKLLERLTGRIFYVNGYITLPPPLNHEQEEHYIQKMSEGDQSAGQNSSNTIYALWSILPDGLITRD